MYLFCICKESHWVLLPVNSFPTLKVMGIGNDGASSFDTGKFQLKYLEKTLLGDTAFEVREGNDEVEEMDKEEPSGEGDNESDVSENIDENKDSEDGSEEAEEKGSADDNSEEVAGDEVASSEEDPTIPPGNSGKSEVNLSNDESNEPGDEGNESDAEGESEDEEKESEAEGGSEVEEKESEEDGESEDEEKESEEDVESNEEEHDNDESQSMDESENSFAPVERQPGAIKAREMEKGYDKFREALRQKAQSSQRQQRVHKWEPPQKKITVDRESAKIIKAHSIGTLEQQERNRKVQKRIEDLRNKRGIRPVRIASGNNQPSLKAVVTKKRLTERIPLVARAVKMPPEEMLILDATLSFLHGLRVGVFKIDEPLNVKKKTALKDWLELSSVSLPQEWGIHEAIDDLRGNIDLISNDRRELVKILNRHKIPRSQWSPSCVKGNAAGSNPFSCGFWKLLHVMSLGVAAHKGGSNLGTLRRRDVRVFSPSEAARTLREYMVHFFPCKPCATHFAVQFDDCDTNRRCDRLSDDAYEASDGDWKEFAKWLWEFHNDVNVRLLNEKADTKRKQQQARLFNRAGAGPGFAADSDQADVLFPSVWICKECVVDGVFDEDAVFSYLENTYWPGIDEATDRMLKLGDDLEAGSKMLTYFLVIVGFYVVFSLQRSLGKYGVQGTMIRARTMRPKGSVGLAKQII